MKLSDLDKHQVAEVIGFIHQPTPDEQTLIRAMMEMGISPGAKVEILHFGPYHRDPIAISCRGALIGLGRKEAQLILINERTL